MKQLERHLVQGQTQCTLPQQVLARLGEQLEHRAQGNPRLPTLNVRVPSWFSGPYSWWGTRSLPKHHRDPTESWKLTSHWWGRWEGPVPLAMPPAQFASPGPHSINKCSEEQAGFGGSCKKIQKEIVCQALYQPHP